LLCGQLVTDAPGRSARLTTEVPASASWVNPMIIATTATAAIPVLVGTGFAMVGNFIAMAIAGGAALCTVIIFGAVMLGGDHDAVDRTALGAAAGESNDDHDLSFGWW